MRLTKAQKQEILPLLQNAVQAQIDLWDATGAIEGVLGRELDSMSAPLEPLAVSYDSGADVKIEDVQPYINDCREV
jgi:hypothetical protein